MIRVYLQICSFLFKHASILVVVVRNDLFIYLFTLT